MIPLNEDTYANFCKSCPKDVNCCIFDGDSGFTFITPKEAKKIRNSTKKEYSYFLDYSPLSKKIVNELKYDDPALEGRLRYSQLDKKNRILRLKTKKEGRCIFLNDDGRCSIYNIRPNICKMFPFWAMRLTNGKIKVIEHDENPRCGIMKFLNKTKQTDIDEALPKKEAENIKKLFRKIEKESVSYKKEIEEFVKEL